MGRGKHENKIEEKTQVNVKLTISKMFLLKELSIVDDESVMSEFSTYNSYINNLIDKDLKERMTI